MNLRDLRYFVILADTKHFGEAAKRCFVSQPTLLSYIPFENPAPSQNLSLFWRSSSPKGQCLQAIAEKIKGCVHLGSI